MKIVKFLYYVVREIFVSNSEILPRYNCDKWKNSLNSIHIYILSTNDVWHHITYTRIIKIYAHINAVRFKTWTNCTIMLLGIK